MEERKNFTNHKIAFDNRKMGLITGVSDVISFDEKEICLKTCAGKMTIQGSGLTLTRLDLELGETDIQGTVDGVLYSRITPEKSRNNKKNLRRWFS